MSERASVPTPEMLLEHRAWLRAIARGLVADENVVDDVEQRAWMTVMRNRRPVESAKSWLRRVVRSAAADEHRAESRRHAREARAARPEGMPSTEHLVVEAEAQRSVAAAVTELAEPYRGTILLRYFEGLTPTEIAERSGVPVDTVKTRLKRALAMLRAALDREFGDRRAWALVLFPLAHMRIPASADSGIAATVAAGMAMGGKAKAAALVVAVALAVTGVVWSASSGGSEQPTSTLCADATSTSTPAKESRAAVAGPTFAAVGRVRSRHDGRCIEGAHVAMRDAATRTHRAADSAADGTFRLDGVAAGALEVTAPHYRTATLDVAPVAAGAETSLGDVWLESVAALVVDVRGAGDRPLAGAEVRLVRRRPSGETATTHSYLMEATDPDRGVSPIGSAVAGAGGTVRFDAITPGNHQIAARAEGFAAAGSVWVDVPPGSAETYATVRLASAHRIAGCVVTAAGAPAADRLVDAGVARWDDRGFARTDAEGRFVLDGVPAGDVTLRVGRSRGENPAVATVRVPDVSEVELRLPPMGAVTGKVALEDGTAVAGAEIGVETRCGWNQCADARTVTDAQGRYRLDEIPAGTLERLVVWRAGLYHVGPRLELGVLVDRRGGKDTGIAAQVVAGAELHLDVTMAKGARLHGRVTGPDGAVGGAWIYVHLRGTRAGQEWETAVCDGDGNYAFDCLPPGRAAAVPIHAAYVHPEAPQEALGTALARGRVAPELTFDLPEGGDVSRDFTMVAGTRVAGRVVGPTGSPLAGAVVRCDAARSTSPPTLATTSDANGGFVLERVAGPGNAKLRVQASGLVQANVPEIALEPAGRVADVEVRMVTAPQVRGRVFDAEGAPVLGAQVKVHLEQWDGGEASLAVTSTDAAGAYAATAARASGRFVVVATLEDGEPGRATVDVTPDGAVADIRLPAAASVAGRVALFDGGPVAGAQIFARTASRPIGWYYGDLIGDAGPDALRATTDDRGRFRLTLAPGGWALIVRRDGLVDEVVHTTVPVAADVEVRMRPATTFSGIARGSDGSPLAGALLVLEPGGDVCSERMSCRPLGQTVIGEHLLARHADGSGAFEFPGLPEGDYGVVVELPSSTSERMRDVRFGPLRPSGSPHLLSVAAPNSGTLAGVVVDASGAAYVGARMWISLVPEGASDPSTRRDLKTIEVASAGSFRVADLAAASYTLQVTVYSQPQEEKGPGGSTVFLRTQRHAFHGLHPSPASVTFEMSDGLRATGRLLDDEGAPLAGWTLTANSATRDLCVLSATCVSRPDGTFEFAELEDVKYGLAVSGPDGRRRRIVASRDLRGGTHFGDVKATHDLRIRGRVTDKTGAAVAGATVEWFVSSLGAVERTTTTADGAFEFTGLDPGTRYCIGVNGADGKSWWSGKPMNDMPTYEAGTTDVHLVRE